MNKGGAANSLEDLGIKNLWGKIRFLQSIRQHGCSGNQSLLQSTRHLHSALLLFVLNSPLLLPWFVYLGCRLYMYFSVCVNISFFLFPALSFLNYLHSFLFSPLLSLTSPYVLLLWLFAIFCLLLSSNLSLLSLLLCYSSYFLPLLTC